MDFPAKRPLNGRANKTPSKRPPQTKPKPKLVPSDTNGPSKDPVEVYCRLRPLKNPNDCVCIKRLNDNTLQLLALGNNKLESYYTFKYVFNESTTQKIVFDRVGLPLIKDLINGKNGLLFTYGITSSGKTFTVTGNSQDCGLLPRTLDVLFNSIEDNMSRKFVFKPDGQNGFEIRSTPDALLEWQREKQIVRTPSALTNTPKVRKRDADDLREWEQRDRDDTKLELQFKGNAFAVFVSYTEIYNNYIYDLLDDDIMIDPIKMKQPQSKVLREDKKRRVFVYGVNEVEVKTADEAFDLFVKGIRRRRMAHTALNTESSRSHSVFNIRVVQAPCDADGEVLQEEKYMVVSQLSLVDLAGSERTQRTQNTGERLREAGNINNSLMALRTCIDLLRENQKYGQNKIVPYRDNKLTHLFKSYFEGEGKIKMIICVNPGFEDFDETLHVMKFAETTQEVLINRANDIPFHMRLPFPHSLPKFMSFVGLDSVSNEIIGPPLPSLEQYDWKDEKQFINLIEILEQRKKNKTRQFDILRQDHMLFRERLAAAESESMLTKQQLALARNDLEAREKQIKDLESACGVLQGGQEDYMRKTHRLLQELEETEAKLEEKKLALSQAALEVEMTRRKMNEKMVEEKERMTRIFQQILDEKQAQLEREKCFYKEKENLVREIMSAEGSNWALFREFCDAFYSGGNPVTPSNGQNNQRGTGMVVGSRTPTATPETFSFPSSSKRPKLASDQGTFVKSTPTLAQHPDPSEEFGNIENRDNRNAPREGGTPAGVPVANPRYSSSVSNDKILYLDHRPQSNLDVGTVLKPKLRNKKSVSSMKKLSVDDVLNVDKYALTVHNAGPQGDIETRVYKGDVIPSAAGGAQVIFKDVEEMVQRSPSKA